MPKVCTTPAPKRGRIALDDFKEEDHPRANNGQFGSGGTAHIVTTPGGGDAEFHGVTDNEEQASGIYDRVQDDDEGAEQHAVEIERKHKGKIKSLHIVHSADGNGGTSIYGVHDDAEVARKVAHEESKTAWENSGPSRGDLDRDEAEENEAVEAWNNDHAADNDDVQVKVDEYGIPDVDADGNLQWEQDGEGVEPSEKHLAAFESLFEEMFPADDPVDYPGLEEANEHFESRADHINVIRVHKHDVGKGLRTSSNTLS